MTTSSPTGQHTEGKRAVPSLFLGIGHLVVVVVVGLVLALRLPASAASYPVSLLTFCDAIAELIPSIAAFEAISGFPMVTRVFLSIQWALVPILAVLIFFSPGLVTPNRSTLSRWSTWKIIAALVVITLVVIVYPAVVQVGADDPVGGMLHEWALRKASTSRLWLGLIGSSVTFTIAYFSALVIGYVRCLLGISKHQQ